METLFPIIIHYQNHYCQYYQEGLSSLDELQLKAPQFSEPMLGRAEFIVFKFITTDTSDILKLNRTRKKQKTKNNQQPAS